MNEVMDGRTVSNSDAGKPAKGGKPGRRPLTLGQPEILHEDNHLIVVCKPAGFLSQADGKDAPDLVNWLKAYVKEKYKKPGEVFIGLVHRLDQPVGGVMVFARTSKAAARLSQQIRERQMDKEYRAVVHGRPQPAEGVIHIRLVKDPATNRVRVDPEGLASDLAFETIGYDAESDCSLLRIRLGSGRGHQIRVSLAHSGWPIVFDQKYGLASDRGKGDVALFASDLRFTHPTRPERLAFHADLPDKPPFDRFHAIDV